MSFAYFILDTINNIVSVSHVEPKYIPPPSNKLIGISDEDWNTFIANWQTKEEWNEEVRLYHNSLDVEDYSPIWDEAKRCPNSMDNKPRYKYINGEIFPTEDVKNIE